VDDCWSPWLPLKFTIKDGADLSIPTPSNMAGRAEGKPGTCCKSWGSLSAQGRMQKAQGSQLSLANTEEATATQLAISWP
jgi:hypothetical protein